MLITTIASCQIEVGNLGSQPNNKKYGEKDERKACRLNLYPIASHGSCKSQFRVWPLWRPSFCKPHFTICTICSNNPSVWRWSCEVVQWLINAFSHNSWNSPWNYIPWSMKTSAKTPNLLNILSKIAYATLLMLRFGNGTSSNHLEKCSIITKTY